MKNSIPGHSEHESAETGSEGSESSERYSRQLDSAREFVKKWAAAGPVLEELKLLRLQELDDETARKMMLDLFDMWRPGHIDDLGAGLVEQQRIFAKLRERDRSRKQ
jgi:hypothetical protein